LFVPIISTFYGIVIRMFYREHEPAHVHAEYSGQQAKFDFDGKLVAGEMSRARLVNAFGDGHSCIVPNSRRMGENESGQMLETIEPLSEEKR
jgi:hypothetical protein